MGSMGSWRKSKLELSGNIKKNMWLIDSSLASYLAHRVSPCILLALKLFLTDIQPDTNCHKKIYFRWALNFLGVSL